MRLYDTDMDAVERREAKKKLYQFILAHNDDPKMVRTVEASVDSNVRELIFIRPKRGQSSPTNSADLVKLQVKKGTDGKPVGAYYAPIIKVNGTLYILAKLNGGEYTINYDNYINFGDANATSTLTYVPVSTESVRTDLDSLTARLSDLYNANNGIIFNYNTAVTSINKVLGVDEIVTDSEEAPSSSAEEGYDDAAERTKDNALTSSDGKEQCKIH